MTTDEKPDDRDNVMGVRKGKGPDQYGGSFGGGASSGGAYANPHAGGDRDISEGKGGQTVQGYYGGGQAGADGSHDHNAASRQDLPETDIGTLGDHPSQQPGTAARARFNESLEREAIAPGDSVAGSDGEIVSGTP